MRWLIALFLAIVPLSAAPQISQIEPLAVVPGSRTVLTFFGSNLESVSNLWTSFGAEVERVKNTNSGKISFAVRCPADATGIHALQLLGPQGASPFRLLMVDYLPAARSSGLNQNFTNAMNLTPPVAVDAQVKSEAADFYKFNAKANESFSIEIIAHRLGSQMDPSVRVLDAAGKEIAFCDDEGGIWRDARFRFSAPLTGEYTIVVNDVGFAGGANHNYRLRVSNDPLVWFTFPLIDPVEHTTTFESIGEKIADPQSTSPANPSSAPVIVSGTQLFESEPNNERTNATSVPWPGVINGKLANPEDVDLFQFSAQKNDRLIFQSQTRSLGSPCDLALKVRKKDGSVLAQSDTGSANDAALTNKFDESGSYFLEVKELSGYGATNAPYRVRVENFEPGFTASVDDNIVEIKRGEKAKLKVTATRYEYDAPIRFKLEPDVAGLTIEQSEIGEKKKETELVLAANDEVAAGFYQQVKIVGLGTNDVPVTVSTRPALKKGFPLMLNPPPVLEGVVTIVVREK